MYLQLCVVWVTATDEAAVRPVGGGVVAVPLVAVESLPPVGTGAGAVDGVTGAPVLALTRFLAVQTVGHVRALLLTLYAEGKKVKTVLIQKPSLFRKSSGARQNATHITTGDIPGDL